MTLDARYSEATIENTNFSYLSEILFEPGSNTGIERYKVTSTVEEIVNPVTGELKVRDTYNNLHTVFSRVDYSFNFDSNLGKYTFSQKIILMLILTLLILRSMTY